MRSVVAAALLAGSATLALAAEPIEGSWKTASDETAVIAACGENVCVTLRTGKHAGRRIGKMQGSGDHYSGEITDPSEEKTYTGYATVAGSKLRMKGCVMSIFCKSQSWNRL